MNKERSRIGIAVSAVTHAGHPARSRAARLGLTAALGASLVLCGPDMPRAQKRSREPEVTVTGISSGGGTVSITADGSLNRAQTWQDSEGFHVVLPNGQTTLGGSARGVKVRRVGNSLELVVPVSPGAGVTVRPRGERLDLVMSGGGPVVTAPEAVVEREARPPARRPAREAAPPQPARPAAARRQEFEAAPAQEVPRQRPQRPGPSEPAADDGALAGAAPKAAAAPAQQPAPAGAGGDVPPAPDAAQPAPSAPAEVANAPASLQSGASLGSIIFSLPALLVLLGLGLAGALAAFVLRRRRGDGGRVESPPVAPKKQKSKESSAKKEKSKEAAGAAEAGAADAPFEQSKGDRRKSSVTVPFDRRRTGVGAEDQATREVKTLDGRPAESVNPALPAVQFGAYRIDQEVALLVQGRPHSVEVISSRAADDRRALATSLQKALRAPETDEDGRRRARMALEDYGFVARECASLLLGAESFERASAARVLGEMRSAQALPFLTEALYDADPVVRVASVQSLGALGLPSAIGALLHTAHRHPEIPASVVGPALTACSVETLELAWESQAAGRATETFEGVEEFAGDVRMIAPACGYEELPDWVEDETLGLALAGSESEDAGARAHAAQALAQFQVRRAVEALAGMATLDAESAVRAAAVTSLGLINHESVFVPVIVAMADSAREVRAAAARALSGLSFDRAEAYIRVFETADARTLSEVARACVSAGLAGQAINRLASEDRRQSYEAYSLLSLVVKAGEVQPLVDAIECHRDTDVRLACVGLLGQAREAGLADCFQHLSESREVPERVRAALREAAARDRQPV